MSAQHSLVACQQTSSLFGQSLVTRAAWAGTHQAVMIRQIMVSQDCMGSNKGVPALPTVAC
eukprot:1774383-Alexandrium_andersonii.AAC.1